MKHAERFEWNDDIQCGVRVVDLQHRKYFDLANALLANVEGKVEASAVGEALEFLRLYVVEHFGTEENLMAEFRYPEAPGHCRRHRQFRDDLAAVQAAFGAKGATPEIVQRLSDLLVVWFINHIRRVDSKLCAYLRGRAVEDKSIFAKLASLTRSFLRRD